MFSCHLGRCPTRLRRFAALPRRQVAQGLALHPPSRDPPSSDYGVTSQRLPQPPTREFSLVTGNEENAEFVGKEEKEGKAEGRYKGTLELDANADSRFAAVKAFWVHLTMTNASGTATRTSNRITGYRASVRQGALSPNAAENRDGAAETAAPTLTDSRKSRRFIAVHIPFGPIL